MKSKLKILYLVTEDSYFLSHRLIMAKAAQEAGFEVHVATHITHLAQDIQKEGFILWPTQFSRNNSNLWKQFKALLELIYIFRQVKPNIVHNIALKAIVFGGISSCFVHPQKVIHLIAGLGSVFIDHRLRYKILATCFSLIFRVLFNFKNTSIIVQNSDDFNVIQKWLLHTRLFLIKGSGIDTQQFSPADEAEGKLVISLVGRLLIHKGVREFAEAARLIHTQNYEVEFRLIGGLDPTHPAPIHEEEIRQWEKEEILTWTGHQTNIAQVWKESHIAVLPSYREGLPRSLLEAGACGRAIVASDAPGCREIVQDGHNGFLVPIKNPFQLATALEKLIQNCDLRKQMGQNSRKLVCTDMSNEAISQKIKELYTPGTYSKSSAE